jgi:RNA polymerase sigma factor (sigma-70 family)
MKKPFSKAILCQILKTILYCCLVVATYGYSRSTTVYLNSHRQAYNYRPANYFHCLSDSNKREARLVNNLLKSVQTLKPLNTKEESIAGLLIQLDNVLLKMREFLASNSTEHELAAFCGISIDRLKSYIRAIKIARSRLVLQHIPFVVKMTRQILEDHSCAYQVSYLQLVLEGLGGLRKAAMRYNGQVRFITYSLPFVNDALLRGITKLRPGSFINHNVVLTYYRACRLEKNITWALNRSPSIIELAKVMKTSPQTLDYILRLGQGRQVRMNHRKSCINDDGDIVAPLIELVPSQNEVNFGRITWLTELQVALEELSPLEKRIMVLRYGLDTEQVMLPIGRVAELMSVSGETIRKILHRSMRKIASSHMTLLSFPEIED